jgi:small subunit ribosomal protein S16
MGAKKRPFYRVVVKERRSKRDGKYLENLGTYDPLQDPAEVTLNHERIRYWIGVGAQPTETVASLIKHNPEMSAEEREAMLLARAEKKAAAESARLEAIKVENARLAAEAAEAAAAEVSETSSEEISSDESASEAPSEETSVDASIEETPSEDTPLEGPVVEEPVAEASPDAEKAEEPTE